MICLLMRKGALLGLFVNRECLKGEVAVASCLGHSVYEIQIFSDRRKTVTKASTLAMERAGFRLLMELVN